MPNFDTQADTPFLTRFPTLYAGFALALKKLAPSLSPNENSWGQPGDSWSQILRSWDQMNNITLDKILDCSVLKGVAVHS